MNRLRAAMLALLGVSAYSAEPSPLPSLNDPGVEHRRKALGGQLSPLPVTQTRWYIADVERAQRMADGGDLSLVFQLMHSARSNGAFSGVLSTRTDGLVQLPKKFVGNPEAVAALEVGHDSVRSCFNEMCPPGELALMAADGVLGGIAVAELVPVQGRDFPVMVRLDPQFLQYRWSENRWYYRSVVGLLPITPGDGRWVLHTPGGRVAPWNNACWRAIALAHIRTEHAELHKDNWEGKLANPARVAIAPQGAAEAQKLSWFKKVMAWGINTVFGLTPGYDVKLLESNGRGHESWEKTIDRCERKMIIAVAGQVVTTDGGAGFSNADIHSSIRTDLIQSTADSLAYTINTQILPAFCVSRFGEDAIDTHSVVLNWDTTPAKDMNQAAQALLAFGSALSVLTDSLARHEMKPDVSTLAQRFAVPISGDRDGDGRPERKLTLVSNSGEAA